MQGGLSGARSSQLAGEDAYKLVLQPLVLAEHVADLARAHSNVSSWHIGVRPCVPHKICWPNAMIQRLQARFMSLQARRTLQMHSSPSHMLL